MTNKTALRISMTHNEQIRGWLYLLAQTALLPHLVSAALFIIWPQTNATAVNLAMFGINALAAVLLFPRFWKSNIAALADEIIPALWKAAIALAVCKLGGWVLNWALYAAAPAYFDMTVLGPSLLNPNDRQVIEMAKEQMLPMSLATVFLVPFAEEALHRGAVFGSIYKRAPLAAYIISISLFALTHVAGYIGSCDTIHLLLCAGQYILPGLALCLLYAKTGTVLAPMIMHMLFNAMGILLVR